MTPIILYIFLIHGLGPQLISYTMSPLKWSLEKQGYQNVHIISYPATSINLYNSVKHVDNEMRKIIKEDNVEIVLIGQSLGGLICHELHKHNWNIKASITVASPHRGSNMLKNLNNVIPTAVTDKIKYPVFQDILERIGEPQVPPHKFFTISTSLYPSSTFDGRIYVSETKINEENHIHIPYNSYWTIFLDPRLFTIVKDILKEK
jgi:hypothetical protein